MKRISFVALFLAALALLLTSCGTSDYLKSLTLSSTGSTSGGFYNLAGVDGTLQLQVIANYNSGKTIDVTNAATWALVPTGTVYSSADTTDFPVGSAVPAAASNTVTINPTGMMTGIAPICTWEDTLNTSETPPVLNDPPVWAYTGYYQVTATYRNFTSQPVGVGVGIAESNSPTGGCGPS